MNARDEFLDEIGNKFGVKGGGNGILNFFGMQLQKMNLVKKENGVTG